MSSLVASAFDRAPAHVAPGQAGPPRPLSSSFPPGLVVDLRTTLCDEVEQASVGWDVRYAQLESGARRCRFVGLHTARLQICLEAWSLGMLKVGRGPLGSATFVVPVGAGGVCRVQGRPLVAGAVAVLLDGEEFDCRTSGPTRLMSLSIERAALDRHVRSILGRHVGELRLLRAFDGLRADAETLRDLCCRATRGAAADPHFLRDAKVANALETSIVRALLSRFEAPPPAREAPSRGLALAREAESWLRRNLAEPPSIARLCDALRASERTLHEAFREHLGTTPKAYVKTLRLNAARGDLLRGLAKTRVTDVALDWGFAHFGWFSQDYRRLFGETPRETLLRSRTIGARAFISHRIGESSRMAEAAW